MDALTPVPLRRRSRWARARRFPAQVRAFRRLGFLSWGTCVKLAWDLLWF